MDLLLTLRRSTPDFSTASRRSGARDLLAAEIANGRCRYAYPPRDLPVIELRCVHIGQQADNLEPSLARRTRLSKLDLNKIPIWSQVPKIEQDRLLCFICILFVLSHEEFLPSYQIDNTLRTKLRN